MVGSVTMPDLTCHCGFRVPRRLRTLHSESIAMQLAQPCAQPLALGGSGFELPENVECNTKYNVEMLRRPIFEGSYAVVITHAEILLRSTVQSSPF